MVVRSPPGFYYPSSFRERTAEVLFVESLVRTYVTPVSSVHDIAESLASSILARFPAAYETLVVFRPDIRRNLRIENLARAECSFSKITTRMKRATAEQSSICQVTTEWHLPILARSGYSTALIFRTQERSASTVYDQSSDLETPKFRPSLNCVHPTFGLHENIARFAEQVQSDRAEGAALLLAQHLFHLADDQSPCKRLQHVFVVMKEVVPMVEPRREQMIGKLRRENNQDPFISCNVQLGRHQYEQSKRSLLSSDVQSGRHRAYLALGSNLGNRVQMVESAVREMSDRGLTVLRTSALYETKPMYLENQESFINGACEVCSIDATANSHPM